LPPVRETTADDDLHEDPTILNPQMGYAQGLAANPLPDTGGEPDAHDLPLKSPLATQYQISGQSPVVQKTVEPTPPHKSHKEDLRRHVRESFTVRIKLIFQNGMSLYGITENISAGGAAILANNALDLEDIALGDQGWLHAIINEEHQSCTEFPFKVTRLAREQVGLAFTIAKDSGEAIKPHYFRTNTQVVVRRSGGRLERGWEVLLPDTRLPATIQRLYNEMQAKTLCVVCKRSNSQLATYKIYALRELKAIQDEASGNTTTDGNQVEAPFTWPE
jgi:hypothetical protein